VLRNENVPVVLLAWANRTPSSIGTITSPMPANSANTVGNPAERSAGAATTTNRVNAAPGSRCSRIDHHRRCCSGLCGERSSDLSRGCSARRVAGWMEVIVGSFTIRGSGACVGRQLVSDGP